MNRPNRGDHLAFLHARVMRAGEGVMPDADTVVEVREEPKTADTEPVVDVTNLKSALDKERTAREAAEKEAKALRKFKQERDAAEQAAADEKAKAEGKYQELITAREARVKELEPQVETLTTERDRYREALTKHLDTQRKDLPKHITALLDKLDPVDQLEWIAANSGELATQPPTTVPRNPKPAGGNGPDEAARRTAHNPTRVF